MQSIRFGFWSLASCCVALFAAGCSKPASTKADKVRIAYFPNITHAAALHAAATGGFQKSVGGAIKVEERVFTAGPAEIEALFAGEVDFGYIGPGPAINGYIKSNGQALEIIDVAASGGASLIATKGREIKSLQDLAYKRIAVPQTGGTQDISLRHALKEIGLSGKDKGGSVDIVQYAPADVLDLIKVFKDMGTEYFMTVGAVKALNKGILLWFTRLDKLQLYSFFLAPTHKDRRP